MLAAAWARTVAAPVGGAMRLAVRTRVSKKWGVPEIPADDRLPVGCLVGTVVSDKMDKTVNVAVVRSQMNRKYQKRQNYTRRFFAHDEAEDCKMGDFVRISPCRPLSKNKHFIVQSVLKRATQIDAQIDEAELGLGENNKLGRNVAPL